MNRRLFFQRALVTVGAVSMYSLLAKAEGRGGGSAAPAALQLIDPKDSAAKAVSYVQDNKEIKDKALQTERVGVKFKDQKCNGCAFYEKNKEATLSGKKAAPCKMPFAAGKAVTAQGWCSSWAKA